MGQTLTHGIYLPDEGERNCYNGLAANWQLLDGAVGTVAEHTSALAGKAPLVHTHTKSDITDFPAYGTTAGTICEGNDSRLSDARTPVAHTHTKSDVTDLLNSNFIPSANNSYNLGSSSYQWNNLYAKNYYYNGTAWGLDKENVWSNYNSYSKGIELAGNRYAYILPEFSANYSGISILTNSFGKSVKFGNYTIDENSVVSLDTTLSFIEISAGLVNNVNSVRIQPRNAAAAELGTSTNKWKSLNGINPGALSLPTTDSTKWVDLSGNLPAASSASTYTPAVDGWISVMLKKTGDATAVFLMQGNIKASCFSNTALVGESAFSSSACIPVRAGISIDIHLKGSGATVDSAYFIPCQGNV